MLKAKLNEFQNLAHGAYCKRITKHSSSLLKLSRFAFPLGVQGFAS